MLCLVSTFRMNYFLIQIKENKIDKHLMDRIIPLATMAKNIISIAELLA